MNITFLYIIVATLLGGFLSALVASLLIAGFPQRWLPRMVSFATGVLLAVTLLDILPEAFESQVTPHNLFATLLVGLLGFYALERVALWRHHHCHGAGDSHGHGHHEHAYRPYKPTHKQANVQAAAPCYEAHHNHGHAHLRDLQHAIPVVIFGDSFHNFVDGILLAAAFLTDPVLGWSTAIAVIAHEIPHEAGAFVLLRAGGLSIWRALLLNSISSLSSVVGGILGYFALQHAQAYLPYVLVIAGSSLLYIAISDLLPLLRKEIGLKNLLWQGGMLLSGVLLILLITSGHGH